MARLVFGLALVCALCLSPAAQAGSIVLGDSGWEAIWDVSLDPFVDIAVDAVTDNAVFIEKSAEFTQGPGPGGFPAIPIVFRQIAVPAVEMIVINDEIITNSTGADWTGFNMTLLDGGNATFNQALTDASGGGAGFSTSPFDNQLFGNSDTLFSVNGFGLGPNGSDATVADGGIWFPGLVGELYIDVVPQTTAPFTLFTLKETPTPEPTTGVLLMAAAALCTRRRRGV